MDAVMVDYAGLKRDPRWQRIVQMMADFPLQRLTTVDEKFAFYINGYNILAINMVISNWPVFTLKSLGTVWRPVWMHEAGVLGGKTLTLRFLEHDILRKMGDPRIHFAINCASMSCPDLRTEPYTAVKLYKQLDDQTRKFLTQTNKGILVNGTDIYLSSIFKWFEEDFKTYGGIDGFVYRYRSDLPENVRFQGSLPYNWKVNAKLSHRERLKALASNDW